MRPKSVHGCGSIITRSKIARPEDQMEKAVNVLLDAEELTKINKDAMKTCLMEIKELSVVPNAAEIMKRNIEEKQNSLAREKSYQSANKHKKQILEEAYSVLGESNGILEIMHKALP